MVKSYREEEQFSDCQRESFMFSDSSQLGIDIQWYLAVFYELPNHLSNSDLILFYLLVSLSYYKCMNFKFSSISK